MSASSTCPYRRAQSSTCRRPCGVSGEVLDLEISGEIRIVQQPLPSEEIQVAYVESEELPKPK